MPAIPRDVLWHPDDWANGVLRTLRSRMTELDAAAREDPSLETDLWITIGHELAHNEVLPGLIELIAQAAVEKGRAEDGAILLWLAARLSGTAPNEQPPSNSNWAQPLFDLVRTGRWQTMTREQKREAFSEIGIAGLSD